MIKYLVVTISHPLEADCRDMVRGVMAMLKNVPQTNLRTISFQEDQIVFYIEEEAESEKDLLETVQHHFINFLELFKETTLVKIEYCSLEEEISHALGK